MAEKISLVTDGSDCACRFDLLKSSRFGTEFSYCISVPGFLLFNSRIAGVIEWQ
jgi:hypothetical protein